MEEVQEKMTKSGKSKFLLPCNSEIEIEFTDFYGSVLKRIFETSDVNFTEIRSSLRNIRSYKNPDIEEHGIVSFDEESDRLSYIFAYGVLHSVILYDRFLNLLKCNKSMLKKIIAMKNIKLCILGGGPALEVVSLSKLFSNLLTTYGNGDCQPLHVYATVIDVCDGWKENAELIIEAAQNNLNDASNIQIHFSFIEADLTSETFSEEISRAIKNAHFVTMFKFLSDVNDASYSKNEIPNMIQKIIKCMSFKACLFFLDTSGGGMFYKIDKLIESHELTARLFGPHLHNIHILSIDSIERLSDTLRCIFRYLKCTKQSTISCSAWLKIHNITSAGRFGSNAKNAPEEISNVLMLEKLKVKNLKAKKKRELQLAIKFPNSEKLSDSESE